MQQQLSRRILTTIERRRMTRPGDRIAVAVSGGGDSLALLFLLEELRAELGVTLTVVHFNHRLRGDAADADERFVRELAGQRGLECLVRSEDVAAAAERSGTNLEEEARKRRYAYFREIVREGKATRVATGHTADDQAETVLARLARGSGLRGLTGIHPVLGPIVRPLLEVRRGDLRAYLGERSQLWREDETNGDTRRFRARIRERVLPFLEAECGGSVAESLSRLADLARKDEALLEEIVAARFGDMIESHGTRIALRASALADPWPGSKSREASEALAARLTRRALQEVKQDLRGLTLDHITRVLDLARQGKSGNRVELPDGLEVERVLDRLFFSKREGHRQEAERISYAYTVNPWGQRETTIQIAETGKRVRLKLIDWPATGRETYREASGALDADRLGIPLVVRNWLPGDAYQPHGRRHVEKLKRLLLERRIAGRDRAAWPVLTSAGKPVWSGGLPVAADFAVGPRTTQALLISEERTEGAGLTHHWSGGPVRRI